MLKKKNLVFLTEHLGFGGAEVVLVTYLKSLDPEKYNMTLIIRDDKGSANFLLQEVPSYVQVVYVFAASELPVSSRQLKKEVAPRVLNIFAGGLFPDAVIDFSPILSKSISQFQKFPMILWVHGDKSHLSWLERFKFRRRWKHYKKIVVLCQEMKEQLSEIFPSVASRFVTIANPFLFSEMQSKAEDFAELNESEKALCLQGDYLLSVARVVPGKDFRSVVEASKINFDRGLRYRHYIIGDGELKTELQALARSYGLQEMLFFLGAKKNPYPWLKNCRFFVHSAIREGLPTVVIEAMSFSKAVIATRCPTGPRDILENGEHGILWPLQDAGALADAIQELITSPSRRVHFEKQSAKRYPDFSAEKIVRQFNEFISSLCEV